METSYGRTAETEQLVSAMPSEARILLVEDNVADAELSVRVLAEAGIDFKTRRVDTREAFLRALDDFDPNIILSDFALPQFDGLKALELLKERNSNIPFILCTGSLSEELAVECMREGASDYILKSSLRRLPSALRNALEKWESQRAGAESALALRNSEYKLRTLINNMTEGLLEVNLSDHIEFVNDCLCSMVEYSRVELIGIKWTRLLFDEDRDFIEQLNERRRRGISDRYETRLRRKDGAAVWVMVGGVPMADSDGKITGSMGVFTDITERKRAEEQLLHDAFHDGLTGLANRSLFLDHLEITIARSKSVHSNPYAVLYLDFDRFKVVNDSLGHSGGDRLLKDIAVRLKACTRTGDIVGRVGGDEFIILLTELAKTDEALLVAERINADLKRPFIISGREFYISASIGIALSTSRHLNAEGMIRDADIAMYYAKSKGKAQFRVFDEAMHAQTKKTLEIETEMRGALDRDEFRMHYQPIHELSTGNLAGFEALIRWMHPTRGLLAPDEFVPIAEENGFILKLGRWAVQESCRQLKAWHSNNKAAGELYVSVNLSCKEFRQPDLADAIGKTLAATGLDPAHLKLEITETHVMESKELASATIARLRALGVELSLDDFGTGYSSLSYLHRLPVNYLKVDRSFITVMADSQENEEIVSSIIKLAHGLKMKVVAEGIESVEQLDTLSAKGCEFGQGYLFARPMEADAAEIFIRASTSASIASRNSGSATG